jgi:adenylate kinase
MNIGIFGLSGVGKTYLASKFTECRDDYILTRASLLIKEGNQEIRYDHLNRNNVNTNQLALLAGFESFKKRHEKSNIIIELHNLIETPEGPVPINNSVFEKLGLDAVCFISKEAKEILHQRRLDGERKRSSATEMEIASYQDQAIELFLSCFSNLAPSKVAVLYSPTIFDLESFISKIG